MTDRKKDILVLTALLAVLIFFFSKILFTDKIIRAPDILNEFYWGVEGHRERGFINQFKIILKARWNIPDNGGTSTGGGSTSIQFLIPYNLILYLFPPPASVAWHIVLHLFFGAAGMYYFCRTIGASRVASFLGGMIFALAPENASLINAGHVMKISTISYAPWAFYFIEKGFQTRRVIFSLTAAVVLAFQFFNTHWQIAYYTCLGIGAYAILRSIGIIIREKISKKAEIYKLLSLNLVTMFFFLSTVAIALIPFYEMSIESTRGAKSGANLGQGGIPKEEGMLWSLPPEELTTFIIPGFFGLSRQEGGKNPTNIPSYYWGRMIMTQTTDYMGLLPWLLLPLPLIFKRDKYTWIPLFAIVGSIAFSMGKYNPVYPFLFDYFPGINRFRVPKMMMFITVMGLGVLAARGIDLLLDEEVRKTKKFKIYLGCIIALPLALLLSLGIEVIWKSQWINMLYDRLRQPTRYEYGTYLIDQRWSNLVTETGVAAIAAFFYAAVFYAIYKRWLVASIVSVALLLFYTADVWRINDKFMFLVNVPKQLKKGAKTPAIEYLSNQSKQHRVLSMGGDHIQYVENGIPVMYTPGAVQQQRWADFIDAFSLASAMPDIMNVKYLIYGKEQYERDKAWLGSRYLPVHHSPDGLEIVIENRNVLPKGWLVPAVYQSKNAQEILSILQNPLFNARQMAVVESPPPIPMASPSGPQLESPGEVVVDKYESEYISLRALTARNSLLVLGEKYYHGWKARVDGKSASVYRVNYVLRGIYLTPGEHKVEFVFDPLPYKIGKFLTLSSFAIFVIVFGREIWLRRGLRKA